jgi:hypothetical protein
MKSSQLYPLKGKCEVDECVIGGKKEGKRGREGFWKDESIYSH